MSRLVQWGRSKNGHITSKCGRFSIAPFKNGRVTLYTSVDHLRNTQLSGHPTQTKAKKWCVIEIGLGRR